MRQYTQQRQHNYTYTTNTRAHTHAPLFAQFQTTTTKTTKKGNEMAIFAATFIEMSN